MSKYNKQLGVAGLLARDELTVQQAHGQEAVKAHALHTDCDIFGLANWKFHIRWIVTRAKTTFSNCGNVGRYTFFALCISICKQEEEVVWPLCDCSRTTRLHTRGIITYDTCLGTFISYTFPKEKKKKLQKDDIKTKTTNNCSFFFPKIQ